MLRWVGDPPPPLRPTVLTGTRVGVAFMAAGAFLILLGSVDAGTNDVLHTLATTLIVFGAVVLSVATEGKDQATD